jgi:GNAT superfamily N-acetyltransferase
MTLYEQRQGNFLVSTDPAKVDLAATHAYLARAYWSEGIPKDLLARAIANSLCFGVYEETGDKLKQVGFTRLVTDCATYAYICDVFILEEYRGHGLSKFMMACVMAHPDLQGLRRWNLVTRDAHGLYRQFGFKEVASPERYMEIIVPGIYLKKE